MLSLTGAGRIFKVQFKRIYNDLFQAGIGLLLFDSEKAVVLRCVFLYFDYSISKKKKLETSKGWKNSIENITNNLRLVL